MTNQWNPDDLELIGTADELVVAPSRVDGSLCSYTTIWVVHVGDDLFVRSYHGPGGRWYRAAQRSQRGRIRAGGAERDVSFADTGDIDRAAVDDAYRQKYGRSTYVDAIVTPAAAATTPQLTPR
jgi:hypothetical protein